MVETIGKKLCKARLAKGLSLEEAAHMTRVRPEKLIALENDDYGRFGSNAYAKGFLQIYGRFLGVDVSEHVQSLETPRHVTISDYQYLNNAPEPEPTRIHVGQRNQRPSIVPLVMMLGLMLMGAIFFASYLFNVTMERLEPKSMNQAAAAAGNLKPASETTNALQPVSNVEPTPAPRATEPTLAPIGEGQTPAQSKGVQFSGIEGPSTAAATETNPANAPAGSAAVVATAPMTNELIVQPLKKTWVKIRRDNATATPVFEDYLYPGAQPLKLRGDKFYVEVREQDAVQIRKNGNPIAYQAPGISIQ